MVLPFVDFNLFRLNREDALGVGRKLAPGDGLKKWARRYDWEMF
jgi:hypothetical protein